MTPLIEAADLKALTPGTYTLIDARGFGNSRERYEQGHLSGALYVDLEQLAAHPDDAAIGGRHPLPAAAEFAGLLGSLGIKPDSHVIVYDDKAAANPAARFWWMLKAIGHSQVQVLNGGLQAAIDAGMEVTTDLTANPEATTYPVPAGFDGTVTIEEVMEAAKDPARMVIDVRETPRYNGDTEPLDLVAGHIPGAVNIPYLTNLAGGKYRPAEELANQYEQALGKVAPEKVIVHCGSGVTACHTLLALEQAGIKGAKLYVGSWSEWSRRDLPVGKVSPDTGERTTTPPAAKK